MIWVEWFGKAASSTVYITVKVFFCRHQMEMNISILFLVTSEGLEILRSASVSKVFFGGSEVLT